MSASRLFTPITVGDITLQHRVALAPLTRLRSTQKEHVPIDIVTEYYSQRSSLPGTLLISEGTLVGPQAGGYDFVPGIWSEEQIVAWKKVTDAVHANKSFIYLQLWASGRGTDPETQESDGYPYVAASDIPLTGYKAPRALTKDEIRVYIDLFAQAAENAVKRAGFDGVEVHGANGYLIDQFFQDVSNNRTDEYGGSIENRSRFALEIVDAVVRRVGAKKTGVRLSPWSTFQDMRMADPIPQFSHFITQLSQSHPDLAYLHVVEPRVSGGDDNSNVHAGESNDVFRGLWKHGVFLSAGGYNADSAAKVAEKNENEIIVFGRYFISNPDLAYRLRNGIAFTPYDRKKFYTPGQPEGYIDYPFATGREVPIKVNA